MAIRKRGRGYQIDYYDPSGKRIRKNFKKKKDAENELAARRLAKEDGNYYEKKRTYTVILKELLEKYKENYCNQRSWETYKKYGIESIEEYFGRDRCLSEIRYIDIETYQNHLRKKLTKSGTIRKEASINREMAILRHMLNKAVEWDMMEKSPFDRGKSLQLKENNKRLRFLSHEEIEKLLPECPTYLRRIVVCALSTGMRRGEILSLKWEQIRNGFIYLQRTKTNEGREIPINDTLEALFEEIRQERHLRSEYVFTYQDRPLHELKRAFGGALRRAGIQDFRFHDLRHTFASHLVMNGASIKDVQELLGHKDTKMTNRYAHLSPEHKTKAVRLLNDLTASAKQNGHKMVTKSETKKSKVS